eukprot:GGOE01041410.1.p1 GENE.GGOE01041410.1~~GGOE01041410.1.p1  ORF type:complete len:250 (+),score=51.14 GGOE01041410.1:80-829(+)
MHMACEDPTRRAVPSTSVGVSHPPITLSLVDECVRALKERWGLDRALLPTVQLPGWDELDIPLTLKTKLLSNLPADQLRRFDCLNHHIDTQCIWKGLCKRDFPDDFVDATRPDWREYYDLLRAGHRHKASRIASTLRQGLAWQKQLTEARRAQSVPTGCATALYDSAPMLPLLQRREECPKLAAPSTIPRPVALRPSSRTRPAVLARVIASSTLSRKESLRLAADTAQNQLRNRHATSAAATAKRQRLA